jgi:hypothetical protein
MRIYPNHMLFSFHVFQSVLQNLKNDVKAGRVPMRGVNLGGWLVAEYWMTSASPAWSGVPTDVANHGEFKTMQYLGISEYFLLRLFDETSITRSC